MPDLVNNPTFGCVERLVSKYLVSGPVVVLMIETDSMFYLQSFISGKPSIKMRSYLDLVLRLSVS